MSQDPTVSDLVGLTMRDVTVNADKDVLRFTAEDGTQFEFYHDQDCCEHVSIEDITGDLQDLVGSPIWKADEAVSEPTDGEHPVYDSATWTFYTFRTMKGTVTVRWLGSSNGYYSESVSLRRIDG